MAAVSEATLIDFESSAPPPAPIVVDKSPAVSAGDEKTVASGTITTTTTIDTSPSAFPTKHRSANQAEYDSGVEDDNQHGKKTTSPDTPSPGAHSPPLEQAQAKKQSHDEPAAAQGHAGTKKPTERPKTMAGSLTKTSAAKAPGSNTSAAAAAAAVARPKTTPTANSTRTSTMTTTKKETKEHVSNSGTHAAKPGLKNVQSKIGSLDYAAHKPGGGNVKIQSQKLNFSTTAKPKIGGTENLTHTPGGGEKKRDKTEGEGDAQKANKGGGSLKTKCTIETRKLEWKAESKIGSLRNASHKPSGGDVKVPSQKLEWKAQSKIGSLENTTHKPTGGNVKIFDQKVDFSKKVGSKIGSLEKADHKPGGGNVQITAAKVDFSKTARPKIGSLENANHRAGGGNVKIKNEKVDFSRTAKPKVGSLENADHTPGGGDVKITNEKLKIEASSKIGSLPGAVS